MARAHRRFYRSGEIAATAGYFLAVRMDGERKATISHFLHDLVQSVCALQKYGFCRVGCRVRSSAKNQGKEKKEVSVASTCKSTTTERAAPKTI
jgi:hypothetical protein